MEQKKAPTHGSSFIIVKCANCKGSDKQTTPKKCEDRNHHAQVSQRSNEQANEWLNERTNKQMQTHSTTGFWFFFFSKKKNWVENMHIERACVCETIWFIYNGNIYDVYFIMWMKDEHEHEFTLVFTFAFVLARIMKFSITGYSFNVIHFSIVATAYRLPQMHHHPIPRCVRELISQFSVSHDLFVLSNGAIFLLRFLIWSIYVFWYSFQHLSMEFGYPWWSQFDLRNFIILI